MRTEIFLFDGFDELDALGPFEVLKNAAEFGAAFDVRLVSYSGRSQVVGAHGLCVTTNAGWPQETPPQLVIVPGGGWNTRNPRGAWAEAQRGAIPSRLAELHRGGTVIAAVCTGTMLLSAEGLLAGRPAVTHHGAIEELRAAGAEVISARVVDDGDVITSGGVTAGLDLALWLVERFSGSRVACKVEREMEYERRGVVWRR